MAVAVVLVNLVSSSASANRIYGRWSLAHSLTHSLAHSLSHSQLNNREHCQLVTMHWAGSLSLSCCCCWAELSNKLAWQKRFGHCDSPHWYGDGVCKCASVCLCLSVPAMEGVCWRPALFCSLCVCVLVVSSPAPKGNGYRGSTSSNSTVFTVLFRWNERHTKGNKATLRGVQLN